MVLGMLLNTAEAKRRILEYLKDEVEGPVGEDIRSFTVGAIRAAVRSDSYVIVMKALEALQKEGSLERLDVHMKVRDNPSTHHGMPLQPRD